MPEHPNHISAPLSSKLNPSKAESKEPRSNLWKGWLLIGFVVLVAITLIKFVYECGAFDTPKKLALSNYLRAQMSEAEFALYALTALTSIGRKSRAICIAFDFYQNRLLSTPWAKGLPERFDPRKEINARLAKDCDFPPLVPVSAPC